MSDYKKWLNEKFGENVAENNQLVADNFQKWFGQSKIVDSAGIPKIFHHGTGNLASIEKNGFMYEYTGHGNDESGPGWYFTDNLETAKGYQSNMMTGADDKLGGSTNPGIVSVYVSMQNPIITEDGDNFWRMIPKITVTQAKNIILQAPDIRDPDGVISNFGDLRSESFESVLNKTAKMYSNNGGIFTLSNDFFSGDSELFLKAILNSTKYDGVIKKMRDGEMHIVCWHPGQMKSINNAGLFEKESSNIFDKIDSNIKNEILIGRSKAAKESIDEFLHRKLSP